MNKKSLADESDVNLFELLKIIWDDKIKVIIIQKQVILFR